MKARARAEAITEILNGEYPNRQPLLVYRSPFELVISVILSAQTTDAQVNKATPALFEAFPTPAALAAAPLTEVEQLVRSTGFYRNKARNIVAAAGVIEERFGGMIPESMEELVFIPGIGRKSANVIRGVVYGKPSIVVDTHLTRVTNRIGLVSGKNPEKLERELKAIVPDSMQTDFSMAVNLHGRAVCSARKPLCERCAIRELCDYGSSNA
ncbi:MAG: endonuclease III [Spirochaetales bacterium]